LDDKIISLADWKIITRQVNWAVSRDTRIN
jgi:hypothetical protein